MRHLIAFSVFAMACGPKVPPAPATPATPPPAAALPPPPPPLPEPEPEVERNADFRIAIDYADGSSTTGRVVHVERGVDFYGANGFTDRDIKTSISLSGGGRSLDADWADLSQIDIDYDTSVSNISCTYDSSVSPWAYICTIPSTSTATTTDGSRLDVTTRNVWRLTMDDDREVELYLFKLPVREADSSSSGMRNAENPAMYVQLREGVVEAAASAPTRIRINP